MHEFFCLNVDDGELLMASAMAYMISELIHQDVVLFVDSVPHFAKYVKNVQFSDDVEGELWSLARRKRKIQQGEVDGKTNLWLEHHRGYYVVDKDDPIATAAQIVKEYINNCGIRKKVLKSKFADFVDVPSVELPTVKSFNQTKVCLLPGIDSDTCNSVLSSRDIYGFYNPHIKKTSAFIPTNSSEWTEAVIKSDIVVTTDPLSLLFFLSHLQNKKIVFLNCKAIKRMSGSYAEVASTQELIAEIREIKS